MGGKLAQIGYRLIDQTARRLAEDFFARFASIVGEGAPAMAPPARGPGWTVVGVLIALAMAIGFVAGRLWR